MLVCAEVGIADYLVDDEFKLTIVLLRFVLFQIYFWFIPCGLQGCRQIRGQKGITQ
jgi:hypothetical protein